MGKTQEKEGELNQKVFAGDIRSFIAESEAGTTQLGFGPAVTVREYLHRALLPREADFSPVASQR